MFASILAKGKDTLTTVAASNDSLISCLTSTTGILYVKRESQAYPLEHP